MLEGKAARGLTTATDRKPCLAPPTRLIAPEGGAGTDLWSLSERAARELREPLRPMAGQGPEPPSPLVMERFSGVISQLFKKRIIRMGGAVDDEMANLIVAQMLYLDSEDPEADITMYINSPGGSVTAGMAIFDTMRHIRPNVSTVCVGLAASMGAFILASGEKGKRYGLPNSRIMIHQPLGGTQGQAADIEIQANEILHHKLVLNGYLCEFTGQTMETMTKDTDRDNFMSSAVAKEYGLIDDIIVKPGVIPPGPELMGLVEKGLENPYTFSIYDAAGVEDSSGAPIKAEN